MSASDPTEGRLIARLTDTTRPPLRTAVAHPVSANALKGPLDAAAAGVITPVLIGPAAKIQATAEEIGADLSDYEQIDVPHSHAAAAKAVELARDGEAGAVMKGALHTNELMVEIISKEGGLRTERRMSHVFVLDTPAYPKPLLISDGAVNVAPDLVAKRWITQNAIDVARAIGIERPKTAILSATEEVDPIIASTIDAAALCKMADRGQIEGGILDGPLAFDLAVSQESVKTKGLTSEVAGDADILIVPALEAGNMLAKQLDYLAGATAAGLVVGARVPIVLTSRSDSAGERLASCALAACLAAWQEARS